MQKKNMSKSGKRVLLELGLFAVSQIALFVSVRYLLASLDGDRAVCGCV